VAAPGDGGLVLTRISPAEDARTVQAACGSTLRPAVGTWRLSINTLPQHAVSGIQIQRKRADVDTIQLLPGQSVEVGLVLSSQPARLRGKLLGPNGIPAPGALVFLKATDPQVGRLLFGKGIARTDDRGEFVFAGLPAGRYTVAGSFDVQNAEEADWTRPSLLTVELPEGKEVTLDVPL
jgi:hypothetical protein